MEDVTEPGNNGPTEPEITLGNYTVHAPGSSTNTRLAILLWGKPGCGKTSFAATAPGQKLWILFDPDGAKVLSNRDDVMVLDLSGERHTITEKFMSDDPLGIEKVLTKHPEIETVVFDSLTAYATLCTESAVALVKSATIENPGMKGYGHRSARVMRTVVSLLRLTKRLNRHFILIAHEGTPDRNDNGDILQITIALSDNVINNAGLQLSEIWHLEDTGKMRRLAIRPCRLKEPMKSRMFIANEPEFTIHYDADKLTGDGIANWYEAWKAAGCQKIPLPK